LTKKNYFMQKEKQKPSSRLFSMFFLIIVFAGTFFPLRSYALQNLNSRKHTRHCVSSFAVSDTTFSKTKSASDGHTDFIVRDTTDFSVLSVNKSEYDFDNFRFFGDIFRAHFPSYYRDFGLYGQPHSVDFYGLGDANLSTLYNGIPFEEPQYGLQSYYRFQENGIASVTLNRLPRGFLYGAEINPISVNFNSFHEFSRIPHTRIFYFQGPNEEAMINIYFASKVTDKLFFSFDLGNAMISPEYRNSDYDTWNGNVKLTYFIDSTFAAEVLFSRYRAVTQLFGGVDVDSLKRQYGDNYEEYFYNGYLAPVMFSQREMKTEWNNYALTVSKRFSRKHALKFIASFSDYETRLTDNYSETRKTHAYFANLTDTYDGDFFFGNGAVTAYYYTQWGNLDYSPSYSLSASGGIKLLNRKLKPSIFGRITSGDNSKTYGGFGFDVNYSASESLSIYAGFSKYSKYYPAVYSSEDNRLQEEPQKINAAEAGVSFKSQNATISASLFSYENNGELYHYVDKNGETSFGLTERNIKGLHVNGALKFGIFLAEFNYSYLDNELNNLKISPRHILNAGIFYSDYLFDNNLKMKTGLNFYFTGKQNYFYRDFFRAENVYFYETENSQIVPFGYGENADDSFTTDFFFVGRIQDRANIYFIFENLFDTKYFLTPYYPETGRAVRLGVSWDLFN